MFELTICMNAIPWIFSYISKIFEVVIILPCTPKSPSMFRALYITDKTARKGSRI